MKYFLLELIITYLYAYQKRLSSHFCGGVIRIFLKYRVYYDDLECCSISSSISADTWRAIFIGGFLPLSQSVVVSRVRPM